MSKEKVQPTKKVVTKRTPKQKAVKKTAVKTSVKKKLVQKATQKKVTKSSVKNLQKPKLYNKIKSAPVSPSKFSVNIEQLAIQSARVMGMAFVMIGAFFTLLNIDALSADIYPSSQLAAVSGTNVEVTTEGTSGTVKINVDIGADITVGHIAIGLKSPDGTWRDIVNKTHYAQTYSATWDSSNEPDGTYDVRVAITDLDTNQMSSGFTSFTTNNGNSGGSTGTQETIISDPTCTFDVSDPTISSGDSVTLEWSTTDTDSVYINNGVGDGLGLEGTHTVSPSSDTSYTLYANGMNGTNVTCETFVYVEQQNVQSTANAGPMPATDLTVQFGDDQGRTSSPLGGNIHFKFDSVLSEKIEVWVRETDGHLIGLGRATAVDFNAQYAWSIDWNSSDFATGDYKLKAVFHPSDTALYHETTVITDFGVYNPDTQMADGTADSTTGAVVNTTEDNATGITTDTAEDTVLYETAADDGTVTIQYPAPVLEIPKAAELKGEEDVFIMVSDASLVKVYVTKSDSLPKDLGTATLVDVDAGKWRFKWNTVNTLNGNYRVHAVAALPDDKKASAYVAVVVSNPTETEEDVPAVEESVGDTTEIVESTEAKQIQEEIEDIVIKQDEYVDTSATGADEASGEKTEVVYEDTESVDDKAAELLEEYKIDIENELTRLASAIRSGDQRQIDLVLTRIQKLRQIIIQNAFTSGTTEFIAFIDKKLDKELAELQEKVVQVEVIIKERVGDVITIDTDGDGITDFDEVTIYNTDPEVADSDNDGIIDGVEILNGYDPLDDVAKTFVVYESPKEKGIVREDLLTVANIMTLVSADGTVVPDDTKAQAVITGTGLPNSFVRIYIFSTPTMVTVKTDNDGNWSYTFDKELEDGEHEIYVGITDNAGALVAKSNPLTFVKTVDAFSVTAAANEAAAAAVTQTVPERNLLSENMLLLVMSISIIIIGLILLLLGLYLRTRQGE